MSFASRFALSAATWSSWSCFICSVVIWVMATGASLLVRCRGAGRFGTASVRGAGDGAPHPLGRGGHVDVANTEVRERVDDRRLHRGRGADRAGLADALGAERV